MKARRWAAGVAVAGTALIGVGAFWISFTTLANLAGRAGVPEAQTWVWAAIVDGVIVTSTVAAVSLDGAGARATWFAWLLLGLAAGISVVANITHAVVAAPADIPLAVSGAIAAVPPLVLLAMTHLTVIVVRHAQHQAPVEPADIQLPDFLIQSHRDPTAATGPRRSPARRRPRPLTTAEASGTLRQRAETLRVGGLSNAQIAAELGVHRSTVGRWFLSPTSPATESEEDVDE